MTTPWIVLTGCALALTLAGWVPRRLRPAPTIVAAVLVLASGAVTVSLEGLRRPFLLVLLGAALALGFAIGHRVPTRGSGSRVGRVLRWMLALVITAAAIGLVSAGAAASVREYPVFAPPAPAGLAPIAT